MMKSVTQGKFNWRSKRCLKFLERGSTCHFCLHLNELLPLKQSKMEKHISRNRKFETSNKLRKNSREEIIILRKDMVRSCNRVLADKLSNTHARYWITSVQKKRFNPRDIGLTVSRA
ncbi:hypothetical protein OUZ56_009931 [Daphnia magna]|uniref:Uncharacterized protein n=1 Tax=Daphnia magna TaxID=35525 RepID=A0ABR0AHP3_9CRUS|nr:hypothetical protein OUZ56_009931 [Daphnia magna]